MAGTAAGMLGDGISDAANICKEILSFKALTERLKAIFYAIKLGLERA